MMNNQLKTFTDRREAIALFNLLRGRDPNQPWPLLPIIAFIAPSGCGKSMLIDYLRSKHCCLPDGRAAIPYTYLDFTLADTPNSPLPFLVALRNQLLQHDDVHGKHLDFLLFVFVAPFALAPSN